MRNILGIIILTVTLAACTPGEQSSKQIIQNAIQFYGGKAYDSLNLQFQFRDKLYALKHNGGNFKYERIFEDSLGSEINDILDNAGFRRLINGKKLLYPAKILLPMQIQLIQYIILHCFHII